MTKWLCLLFISTNRSWLHCANVRKALSRASLLMSDVKQVRQRLFKHTQSFINFVGEFLVALLLAASGIASPSVLSAVYFLVFLAIATWWAGYQQLGRRFRVVRVFLLVYSAAHLLTEYLYQMQFFQEILHPDRLLTRSDMCKLHVWFVFVRCAATFCRKCVLITNFASI